MVVSMQLPLSFPCLPPTIAFLVWHNCFPFQHFFLLFSPATHPAGYAEHGPTSHLSSPPPPDPASPPHPPPHLSPFEGTPLDTEVGWGDFVFNLVSVAIVYAYFSEWAAAGDDAAAIYLSCSIAVLDIALVLLQWMW
jgi:hypothetical protein